MALNTAYRQNWLAATAFATELFRAFTTLTSENAHQRWVCKIYEESDYFYWVLYLELQLQVLFYRQLYRKLKLLEVDKR